MKLRIFIIVLFLFFANRSFSQNKVIDSLKINSRIKKGKELFKTYTEISKQYAGINLDSAKKYANNAYFLAKEINSDSLKLKALKILGHRSFESADYLIAINNFNKALVLSKTLKDSVSIADIYNGFAIIYSKQGDLNKSIEYSFKTLSIYEKTKDSLGIGNSLLNIGWDYRKLKEFKKSLIYNFKSLEVYEKIKDSLRIAMVNNNIAGTQNELGDYKNAVEYANKSKVFFEKLNYERFTAYPISVMAVSYDSLHNYKFAEKNYLKAIALHTKNREPYELAFLNFSLSNLYYKQKKYNSALSLAKEAFTLANEINAKEYIAQSSEILSKIYEKLSNTKLSNTYLKLLVKYNDSILSDEKLKSIKEIETKYETTKKEKEIAIQKEQLLEKELAIKNRNLYAILITSSLLILAIIFFAVYKRNQLKKKQLQKEIDLKDALAIIKTQNKLQEQRLRISRDLHDNIGSQLTFIISSVDNLKYINKNADEKMKEKLASISSFTSETIHQLRDTIWAMNKSEVTVEDLHTRILSFIEKAKMATQTIAFEIDFNINENESFTSLEGMNIFRVVQEAINNAIKYANASKIEIKLDKKENKFLISVIDDGVGFDINTIELGNGLSNMENRMSEIGGKVKILSTVNKGTEISIIYQS